MMVVSSLMSAEILKSVVKKNLEFTDISLILLVPWGNCKRTAPVPKLESPHIA